MVRKIKIFIGSIFVLLCASVSSYAVTHTTKPHYLGSITFGATENTWLYNAPSADIYTFMPLPFQKWTDKLIFTDVKGKLYTKKSFLGGGGIGYRQVFKGFLQNDKNFMSQMIGVHLGAYYMNSRQGKGFIYGTLDLEYIYNKLYFKFSGLVPLGDKDYWSITRSFKDVPQPPEKDGDLLTFHILRQNNLSYEIDRIYTGGEIKGGYTVLPGLNTALGGYFLSNSGDKMPAEDYDISAILDKSESFAGVLMEIEYDVLGNATTSTIIGRYVPFSNVKVNAVASYDKQNDFAISVGFGITLRTFPIPNDLGIYANMVSPVWSMNPYGYESENNKTLGDQKIYKRGSNGEIAKYKIATTANEFMDIINNDGLSGVLLHGHITLTEKQKVALHKDFAVCGNTCELEISGKDYVFSTWTKKGPFDPSWIQFSVSGNHGIGKKGETGINIAENTTIYDIGIFMSGTKATSNSSAIDFSTLGDAQPAVYNGKIKSIGTLKIKKVSISGGYIDLMGMQSDTTIDMKNVTVVPGKISYLTAGAKLPDVAVYGPDILVDGSIFKQSVTLAHTISAGVGGTVNTPKSLIKGAINIVQANGSIMFKNFNDLSINRDMSTVDVSLGQSGYYYNDMSGLIINGNVKFTQDADFTHIYLSRSQLPGELEQPGGADANTTDNGSLYYSCALCLFNTGSSWNRKLVVSGDVEAIGQNSFGLYFKGVNNSSESKNSDGELQLMLDIKGQVKTTEYGSMGIFQDEGESSGILIEGGVITDGPNASGVFVQTAGTLKNIDIEGGILTEVYSSPGLDVYGTIDSMVVRSGIRAYLSDGIRVNGGTIRSTVIHDLIFSIGTVYTGSGGPGTGQGWGGGGTPGTACVGAICHSGATVNVWSASNEELRNLRYSANMNTAKSLATHANTVGTATYTGYYVQGYYTSADGIHLSDGSTVEGLVVFGIPGYPFTILSTGYPIAIGNNVTIKSRDVVLDEDGTTVSTGISILAANYVSNNYGFSQMLGGRLPFGYINFTYVDQPFSSLGVNTVGSGPLFGDVNTVNTANAPACVGYMDSNGNSHKPNC